MPFAFCTREKQPWCEFAEDAECGPSTQLCQEVSCGRHMCVLVMLPCVACAVERGAEHLITYYEDINFLIYFTCVFSVPFTYST